MTTAYDILRGLAGYSPLARACAHVRVRSAMAQNKSRITRKPRTRIRDNALGVESDCCLCEPSLLRSKNAVNQAYAAEIPHNKLLLRP